MRRPHSRHHAGVRPDCSLLQYTMPGPGRLAHSVWDQGSIFASFMSTPADCRVWAHVYPGHVDILSEGWEWGDAAHVCCHTGCCGDRGGGGGAGVFRYGNTRPGVGTKQQLCNTTCHAPLSTLNYSAGRKKVSMVVVVVVVVGVVSMVVQQVLC